MYGTAAARILFAQKWKQEGIPSKDEWLLKMVEFAEMARLTARIREQEDNIFFEEWKCFSDYLKKHHGHVKSLAGFIEVSV